MAARESVVEATVAQTPAPPVPEVSAAPPSPLGLSGAGDHAIGATLLLGLQATAGNAGVGRMLNRWELQRRDDEPANGSGGGTATLPPPVRSEPDQSTVDGAAVEPAADGGAPSTSVDPAADRGAPSTSVDPAADRGAPSTSAEPAAKPGAAPGGAPSADPAAAAAPASKDGAATADAGPAGRAAGPTTDGAGGTPPASTAASTGDRVAALDAKVRELMEARQDPAAAKEHDDLLAKADMARLAALQYAYTPNTGVVMGLLKPMLPLEQMGERITSLWSGNQYASAANSNTTSGTIAKVQAVIEGIRQALRLVGDVVGAGATVMGYVAIISGLIALIPPAAPIAGPIAAFATSMSLALTLIKVVADLVDAALGAVQTLLLIWRARSTDDATERARIAMLLRREANEMSGSLMNASVGAITYKLGKSALGKASPGQIASEAAQAGAVKSGVMGMGRQLLKGNLRAAFGAEVWSEMATVARSIKAAQVLGSAKQAGGTTLLSTAGLNKAVFFDTLAKETAAAAVKTQAKAAGSLPAQAKVFLLGKIRTSLAPKIPSLKTKLPGQATSFGAGQGRKQRAVQGATQNDPAATGDEAAAPEQQLHVYWPTVLERYATMRKDIKTARERAQEQHEKAREDAGKSGDAVLTIKGASTSSKGKLSQAGQQIGADASADEQAAGERGKAAGKAQEQETKATAQSKRSDEQREKTRADADKADQQAIQAAQKVREDPGWFSSAKSWVMTKIGNAFKWLQEGLADLILKGAMAAAGLDPAELDVANLKSGADKDKETAGKAKQDAVGLTEDEQRQQKAMGQLLEGASDSEKNAIHGVSDTLDYMRDLDAWDEILAQHEASGADYLEQAAPLLGAQAAPDKADQMIDDAAIAPILQGAERATQNSATGAADLERQSAGQLEAKLGEVRAAFADHFDAVDTTEGSTIGGQLIQQVTSDLHAQLATAGTSAGDITARANALKGTADFAALAALAQETEVLVADVDGAAGEAFRTIDAGIQEILDAYSAAAVAAIGPAIQQTAPPADDGTPPTQNGTSPAKSGPPLAPETPGPPVAPNQTPVPVSTPGETE